MHIALKQEKAQSGYEERLRVRQASDLAHIWTLLDAVTDPEIPVLSLWDLGVLTHIEQIKERIVITITPTYSSCPAVEVMREDIARVLATAGYTCVVKTSLSPAWSTDWLSPQGRQKLLDYGIAPPLCGRGCHAAALTTPESGVKCPRCSSHDTTRISEFGSTACKALFQCSHCLEPFDYFKAL